jgi:CxxC motif-containing protein (DUF1111 family)
MSKKKTVVASVFGLVVAVLAVSSMGQVATPPPSGFGGTLPGATAAEVAAFNTGKAAFESAEDVVDGLGPVFNENACVACHSVGATGGGSTRLETRFGSTDMNGVFDPLAGLGGSLLQDHAIGLVGAITYVPEVVPFVANTVAKRRTTPLFGLGLVNNVPDETLVAIANIEQSSSPATAGRVSMVTDAASGQTRAGRFGWKCQQATLFSFSGDAYLNEMGITTPLFPNENCPQGDCLDFPVGPPPQFNPGNSALPTVPNDATNDTLVAFTNFMTFLAPPPRGAMTSDVQKGKVMFARIGCLNCHLDSLTTGPNASAALNRVTFFPFSDFLLHDMGSLNDGIAQPPAGGTHEMRTAPLWGVRLLTTFLHDGRASNLTDAILAHDGQGRAARDEFAGLSDTRKAQLIAFLNSL